MQAIPPYETNLPDDVPGTISSFDALGSMLVIQRDRAGPDEVALGLPPATGEPEVRLALDGGRSIGFDSEFELQSSTLRVDTGRAPISAVVDLASLVSTDGAKTAMIVDDRGRDLVVQRRVIVDDTETPVTEREWILPSSGVEVLGLWDDEVVVHRTGSTWLVGAGGTVRAGLPRRPLAYDGQNLVVVECGNVDGCSFAVGPPTGPAVSTVPVPLEVERVPVDRWASTVAVAPDASAIALAVPDGGIALPVVVDLATGEATALADGINEGSPVVWSPDGAWLAYLYTDDVMVWSLDIGRSWRISVNRDLQTLDWN